MRESEKLTFARERCKRYGLRCSIQKDGRRAQLNIDGICIAFDLHGLSRDDIAMLIDIYRESKYTK
jgi:hypothetical protein